jgi:hypothetical protein
MKKNKKRKRKEKTKKCSRKPKEKHKTTAKIGGIMFWKKPEKEEKKENNQNLKETTTTAKETKNQNGSKEKTKKEKTRKKILMLCAHVLLFSVGLYVFIKFPLSSRNFLVLDNKIWNFLPFFMLVFFSSASKLKYGPLILFPLTLFFFPLFAPIFLISYFAKGRVHFLSTIIHVYVFFLLLFFSFSHRYEIISILEGEIAKITTAYAKSIVEANTLAVRTIEKFPEYKECPDSFKMKVSILEKQLSTIKLSPLKASQLFNGLENFAFLFSFILFFGIFSIFIAISKYVFLVFWVLMEFKKEKKENTA